MILFFKFIFKVTSVCQKCLFFRKHFGMGCNSVFAFKIFFKKETFFFYATKNLLRIVAEELWFVFLQIFSPVNVFWKIVVSFFFIAIFCFYDDLKKGIKRVEFLTMSLFYLRNRTHVLWKIVSELLWLNPAVLCATNKKQTIRILVVL